jgi:hypothetical protein
MVDVIMVSAVAPKADHVETTLLNKRPEILEAEPIFRTVEQRDLEAFLLKY